MTDTSQNFPPHEWIARDAYWGSPNSFVTVAAAGHLATFEDGIVARVGGVHDVTSEYRRMHNLDSGFAARSVAVPLGEPLPVLGERDPGVLQVVHDERLTFRDPDSRAARRAARLAISADGFNEAALAMELPGALHATVTTEVEPGVLVSRAVWYIRGLRMPLGTRFQRYDRLRHVVVPSDSMATMVSTLRKKDLRPTVSGEIDTRHTRIVEDRGQVKLSRVASAVHLKPEAKFSGGKSSRLRRRLHLPSIISPAIHPKTA